VTCHIRLARCVGRAVRRGALAVALAGALVVAAAGLAGCVGGRHAPPVAVTRTPLPAGQSAALTDLSDLDPVARWFAARADQPRLILILSPT
jgi:hypothetical protein